MSKVPPPETVRRRLAVQRACEVLLDSGTDALPPDPDLIRKTLGVREILSYSAAAKRCGQDPWEYRKALLGKNLPLDTEGPSGIRPGTDMKEAPLKSPGQAGMDPGGSESGDRETGPAVENAGLFQEQLSGGEAYSVSLGRDRYLILYDDMIRSPERIRFSLFHEFGHIAMGHLRDFRIGSLPENERRILESEASIFSRNILCPPPIVDLLRSGPEDPRAADLFCVSRGAWQVRLKTLAEDRACIPRRTADLIRVRFRNYLAGRRCRDCGAVFLDESRSGRCPRCGSRYLRWNPAMESPAEAGPGRHTAGARQEDLRPRIGEARAADLAEYWELLRKG